MEKTIFHIDVNSAFLSWSTAEHMKTDKALDFRKIPSAIGGDTNSRRGIILAKSDPAKKYGIITGEPVVAALRKCPNLVVIPPNFDIYNLYSNNLFKFLSQYSDRLEVFSIDECFLDYTGMERLFGAPEKAAFEIKEQIKNEMGFTVNIGIGPNKLLAKMAGELEKPDKVLTIYPDEIEKKLWCLPVSELFMIGRQTAPRLNKMGIFTVGQLANYDYNLLEHEFKNLALTMKNYANGIADDVIAPFGNAHIYKSISNSTTTAADIFNKEDAHIVLLALAQSVGRRLRFHGQFTTCISVGVKTNEFKTYSRQSQLKNPTDSTTDIYEKSVEIFDVMWKKEPLRHLSISADKLTDGFISQLGFNDNKTDKQRQAELAMDKINKKLGAAAVTRCALINTGINVGKGSTFSKDKQ